MNQKEIRDQVENLIRMNRITETVLSTPKMSALDLVPIFHDQFTPEAQNVLLNQKTTNLIVQWNRQVGTSSISGPEAYKLADFLEKFKIKSYSDLQSSNYVREYSKVSFYGQTVERSRLVDATMVLVNFINDLASKNLIRAVLAPLMSIELADGRFAIVSYIAVDQPNEPLVQSMYGSLSFAEGSVPPEFK